MSSNDEPWHLNYYNYFTEVEEHFQRARGTALFCLSTLDWALVETWKNAGIPLEAVLRGIDVAFEKWREKKTKVRMINGLAYCTQAVVEEAQKMEGVVPDEPKAELEAPFTLDELKEHLQRGVAKLTRPEMAGVRDALAAALADAEQRYRKLEDLESTLSALEDKMIAIARAAQSEEDLVAARRELDFHLKPYRSKMSAPQLAMLEKQFLDRWLLERAGLPRLSLFYVR
ncbi:MAG: hypothetical protein U0Q16_29525 [Bryobacteraceae bacterium]